MSDETDDEPAAPAPPMIPITLELPVALVEHYDNDVASGVYPSRAEALRAALVEAWRFHRGRFSTLRLDLRRPGDRRDTDPEPAVEDLVAAADALRDEEGDGEVGEAAPERT